MPVPKVLLLVNSDPKGAGVGELFLSDACRHYPPGRLLRYSTTQHAVAASEGAWLDFRSLVRPLPHSSMPVRSSIDYRRRLRIDVPRLLQEIQALIKNECVELVWAGLSSPLLIHLADRLTQDLSLPMVASVWDDPEYFIANQHMDPWAMRRVLRTFETLVPCAERITVASDGMKQLYESLYQTRAIPWLHGIDRKHWRDRVPTPTPLDRMVIVFAGSLYAKREWNTLLSAIESNGGQIAGRRVIIRFIGRFPCTIARTAAFVEQLGPCSFEECLEQLSQADVAYLPYWFNPKRARIVQTSFPGKMSAYVAAGAPILYHGPRESSPTRFLEKYPVGLACHSLAAEDLVSALETLAQDTRILDAARSARRRALDEVLGLQAMLRRFADLLGITYADLV